MMFQDRYLAIRKIAKKHDWQLVDHQSNIFLMIFARDDEKINAYYSKMTIATVVNHPVKGRTQLYRKHVTFKELDKIFNRPRVHTGKGYLHKIRRFFGL